MFVIFVYDRDKVQVKGNDTYSPFFYLRNLDLEKKRYVLHKDRDRKKEKKKLVKVTFACWGLEDISFIINVFYINIINIIIDLDLDLDLDKFSLRKTFLERSYKKGRLNH